MALEIKPTRPLKKREWSAFMKKVRENEDNKVSTEEYKRMKEAYANFCRDLGWPEPK